MTPLTGPLFSAVIPVHDGEKYLSAAIHSVLRVPYEPMELIVVDDGSNDSRPRIIRQFLGELFVYCFSRTADQPRPAIWGCKLLGGKSSGFSMQMTCGRRDRTRRLNYWFHVRMWMSSKAVFRRLQIWIRMRALPATATSRSLILS